MKIINRFNSKLLPFISFKNMILSRLTKKQSCEIIMILGYQRSGTSALISSFKNDLKFSVITESYNNIIMHKWLLRPEKNIRHFLNKTKKLITKPISESYFRTSGELFEEYKNYNVKYIFIIRNVENVFYSNIKHDNSYYQSDVIKFSSLYNKRMENTIDGLNKKKGLVVRYEDILDNPIHYEKICKFLGVNGKYIFKKDSSLGITNLSDEQKLILNNLTKEIKYKTDLLIEKSFEKLKNIK